MRSRDTLIRLQQFKVEEKRRDVADIEVMIADFLKKEGELLQQIELEEERAGVSDPGHFNYPTTAKAIRDRRENLLRSVDELKNQLGDAASALSEQQSELRKLELLMEKDDGIKASAASGKDIPSEPAIIVTH